MIVTDELSVRVTEDLPGEMARLLGSGTEACPLQQMGNKVTGTKV